MKCKEEWELTCSITYFISLYAFKAPMMVFFFDHYISRWISSSQQQVSILFRARDDLSRRCPSHSDRSRWKTIFILLNQLFDSCDVCESERESIARQRGALAGRTRFKVNVCATLIQIFLSFFFQHTQFEAFRDLSRGGLQQLHTIFSCWTQFHRFPALFSASLFISFHRLDDDGESIVRDVRGGDALTGARSGCAGEKRDLEKKMKPFELSKTAKKSRAEQEL